MHVAVCSASSSCLKFHWHGDSMSKLCPRKITRCFPNKDYGNKISAYRYRGPSALSATMSAGVLTIERPMFDTSLEIELLSHNTEPLLDADGGDGEDGGDGNIGGGGSNNNDDDDYWPLEDGDEDNEEDVLSRLFKKRIPVPEMFGMSSIEAVLSEWMKGTAELPEGLRQACEMGMVSSAEITRFVCHNVRPSLFRLLSRLVPETAMKLQGKIIADPALPSKLLFEACSSLAWSICLHTPDRPFEIKQLSPSVINAFCSVFVAVSLAPSAELVCSRSVPSNVFQRSRGRFLDFTPRARILSFFNAAALFSALGFVTKAASSGLENRKRVLSSAIAAGVSMGLLTNLRYQLTSAADIFLHQHFESTTVSLAFCFALRFLNVGLGTLSPDWIESGTTTSDDHNNLSHRQVARSSGDYAWLDLKTAILTGLRLVHHSARSPKAPSAAKRKRIIRKKGETTFITSVRNSN